MTDKYIRQLISNGENISIEYKSCTDAISASVYETVCSFLNRDGGEILIGVNDKGTILGINDNCIVDMLRNFTNTLNNRELFYPTVFLLPKIIEIDNKKIVYISVPESPQVHRYKNKIYDRIGDADNNISYNYNLIENLYLRKQKNSTENNVCPDLRIEDLDMATFNKVRSHVAIYDTNHPWLSMTNEELLHSTGFWRRDTMENKEGYILATALLFGKESTVLNYCPFHRTDAVFRNLSYNKYLNPKASDPDIRYDDRDIICSNLIESYSRLMTFVKRNLPDKFALDTQNVNRLDLRNMLFREVVANMLVHREYTHSFPSKFLIFSDRVITENWTKPMQTGDVTIDTLETHTKNPLITKIFREMRWVEELGSGKKNIIKYAPLYYNKSQIEINNSEKFVFSITYKDAPSNKDSGGVNSGGVNSGGVNSGGVKFNNIVGKKKAELIRIAELIKTNNGIRSLAISNQLKLSQRSVERYLKILTENKIIEFRGAPKNGGYYSNIENNN
ncbi:MAG: putative DNA binding domain-containing protein [Muribaculaceae bacterium]